MRARIEIRQLPSGSKPYYWCLMVGNKTIALQSFNDIRNTKDSTKRAALHAKRLFATAEIEEK